MTHPDFNMNVEDFAEAESANYHCSAKLGVNIVNDWIAAQPAWHGKAIKAERKSRKQKRREEKAARDALARDRKAEQDKAEAALHAFNTGEK